MPGLERHLTVREPFGVVAALVPFSYPVELYAHKAGAALAAGNAVIVQPPARCPLALVRAARTVGRVVLWHSSAGGEKCPFRRGGPSQAAAAP